MTGLRYLAAIVLVVASAQTVSAQHGHSKPANCGETCGEGCQPTMLQCQPVVKTEKIKRHCFEVECEYVCIPPVQLPKCGGGFCGLFGGGCDGCSETECAAPGCTTDCAECGAGTCGNGNDSLLGRLCSKLTDCRIRKVNTFKKKEYECGEKCVVEWKVVCVPAIGCDKSCGEGCYTAPDCCAPCRH